MQTFSLDWMQEAEKLLQQLPGIFAVRFLAGNDHSTLEAIHILADTARNAKQVVGMCRRPCPQHTHWI